MRVHLIRHGEVENPDHVVYADLPGFVLSTLGRAQARAAGHHLAETSLSTIVTSPLERARETSELISAATNAAVEVDDRLIEWGLASRWAGVGWERLPEVFPGELESYLAHPEDLSFSPESLAEVSGRVAACVEDWAGRAPADIAFVSHEDPLHGAKLILTGETPPAFHQDKPAHCSITSIRRNAERWYVTEHWVPTV